MAARQRRHDRAPDLAGDLMDAPVVAIRRRGEPGLHDVHAQRIELAGEAEFLLGGETVAGRLLAVAQGGVEDQDVGDCHNGVPARLKVKRKAPRTSGPRRRGSLSRRCYCLTLLVLARREPLAHR